MRTTCCRFCEASVPIDGRRGQAPSLPLCADCRCGVYAFEHPVTGAVEYVGSSVDIAKRFNFHRSDVSKPAKREFLRAHGVAALRLLERCTPEVRLAREAEWLGTMQMLGAPLSFVTVSNVPAVRVGEQFAAWTVVEPDLNVRVAKRRPLCRCRCGIERRVAESNLRNGMSRSCSRRVDSPCRPKLHQLT